MTQNTQQGKVSLNAVAVIILVVLLFSSIRRKLLSWLVFTILLSGYILYQAVKLRPVKQQPIRDIRRFKFLESLQWVNDNDKLTIDHTLLEAPAIPESFLISESLDYLFTLIITEFVDSWYTKITSNRLFQDSIHLELKECVARLKERLAGIDLANFLVFKIVPIITDHYSNFVSTANVQDSTYSIESKLSTAQKFDRGRHHEGVSLALPGHPHKKEKEYLRKKVSRLLPNLFSQQESSNETGMLLLRELLACTVLSNVFEVLCEGDFFNQMIVKLIGANLQHRDQVKRLRAALQEHTAQSNKRSLPSLSGVLTPSKTQAWVKYIDECESRNELLHLQRAVQEKQVAVATKSENFSTEDEQLAVLSDRLSWKLQTPKDAGVTLETILSRPKMAEVFREFLRGEKHEADFDLWRAIDQIKAPLETSNAGEVPLSLGFSNKDDILQIYLSFFDDRHIPITDEIRKNVSLYVKCSDSDPSKANYYQQARKSLFLLQDNMVEHMKNHHFRAFQRSNRYGDLDFGRDSRRIRREASLVFGGSKVPDDLIEADLESETISPAVVKAVETAFEKIMKSSNELDSNSMLDVIPTKSLSDINISEKPYLFGDNSSLFNEGIKLEEEHSSNRMSALFDNESDSMSDSASVNSESLLLSTELGDNKLANLEIILAAPGDLTLAEQIATLNQDIDNLAEQDAILASLLRKAELTNNVAELRVLRRSKISVEREISAKELQKQQYIVQENENSLYGKSKVLIQSCIFGNDDTSPYVLYIIEVQKFSSEDPHEVVAGWIVARRFRQFYKLHEYLKRRCPEVANLKFPKKTVPMLNFQKKLQVELRKPMLEKYLQSLLKIPEVCSDPAFRLFLSSEDFLLGPGAKSSQKNFDAFFNRLYGKLGQQVPVTNTEQSRNEGNQEEILANIKEMERELKQFDDIEKDGTKILFVKPISDLLMTIFNLKHSQSWLRGRALLVILHQVLGSTIEKTIKLQVEANLRQEEKLLDILGLLQTIVFPDNKFRESPEIRTKSEQSTTRKEANVIFRIFMNETCAKVFGFKNTNQASTHLFEMFQNDYLNKQLLFEIFDELIAAICPEADD